MDVESALSDLSSVSSPSVHSSTSSIIPGTANSLPRGLYTWTSSSSSSSSSIKRPRGEDDSDESDNSSKRTKCSEFDGRTSRRGFPSTSLSPTDTFCGSSDSSQKSGQGQSNKDSVTYDSTLYGFDPLASGFEYGSDSDDEAEEEQRRSRSLLHSNAAPVASDSEDGADDMAVDISEEDFNAEIDSILLHQYKSRFEREQSPAPQTEDYEADTENEDCDGLDGLDSSDEGAYEEDEVDEEGEPIVVVERRCPRCRTWTRPKPSPLSQVFSAESLASDDLEPCANDEEPSATAGDSTSSTAPRKTRWTYPAERNLRVDLQSTQFIESCLLYPHIDPLTGQHRRPTAALASVNTDSSEEGAVDTSSSHDEAAIVDEHREQEGVIPKPITGSTVDRTGSCDDEEDEISLGSDEDDYNEGEGEGDEEYEAPTEVLPIGRGTPPGECFTLRPTLEPPLSPYQYSTRSRSLPLRRFTQSAFHGSKSWATLFRDNDRAANRFADADEPRIEYALIVGVNDTLRAVPMRTDRRAMEAWRTHLEEVPTLCTRREETTGSLLEEYRVVRAVLEEVGLELPGPTPDQEKEQAQGLLGESDESGEDELDELEETILQF